MATAAVFDLDRTLISDSSAPVFAKHLRLYGLGGDREIPFAGALAAVYRAVGENRLTMEVAKLAVRASKGWSVDDVREAATAAADEIAELLQPYARILMDQHRADGDILVMATTSPLPLVGPLADLLGFDAVIATKWRAEDGVYTGSLDGPFVWGREKMLALRAFAAERSVDLRKSLAYSDSFFDATMLAEVGHPVAVNPDPQLAALAALRRWPIRHLDVPPGVLKVGGKELQDWLRPFNRPELIPYARVTFEGIEHIPSSGAAIVVFNHRSYFDSTAVALLLGRSGRAARFLGKKEVFDVPVVGSLATLFGGIRVNRASGDNEPLERAAEALRAGQLIAMAPQGTIPRGPAFFDPVLRGRWGAARLAAMSGAPVIPVGLWGTERVWPRNQRLPKFELTSPPPVTVNVGPEVSLGRTDPDADTQAIMAALVDLLPDEAREQREPTDEELRATFPPGYKGDPHAESDRRPGTDT